MPPIEGELASGLGAFVRTARPPRPDDLGPFDMWRFPCP